MTTRQEPLLDLLLRAQDSPEAQARLLAANLDRVDEAFVSAAMKRAFTAAEAGDWVEARACARAGRLAVRARGTARWDVAFGLLLARAARAAGDRDYQVDDDDVLLFLDRPGGPGPSCVRLDLTGGELRGLVERAARAGPGRRRVVEEPGWPDLAARLVAPILDVAGAGELVWLVPHDVLHFLPLHAAPAGNAHLVDRNPVCTSPSAAIMRVCLARATGRHASALVMGDTLGDLPYAEEEAHAVADLFGTIPVLGRAATRSAFLAGMGGRDVVHLCCHAAFDSTAPLRSGVVLAAAPGAGSRSTC